MLFWPAILALAAFALGAWAIGRIAEWLRARAQAKLDRLTSEWRRIEGEKKRLECAIEGEWRKIEGEKKRLERARKLSERRKEEVLAIANEKARGFPWLAKAYADFVYLENLKKAEALENKKHPAPRSAARVREIAKARRIVERKLRIAQGIIKYWRSLFPFLVDLLGEPDEELLRRILAQDIERPVREAADLDVDLHRFFSRLPQEEYDRLSPAERYQRALDGYWARRKSKWAIGRDYERYIGFLHEQNGYAVYYQGILEGYEDLGRDLIAKKRNETLVIQCKRWSAYRRIHENHVNQLYGTTIKYQIDHPDEHVRAVLYTSTQLSERAREFARYLDVEVKENFPFHEYASVKCNVSRKTGERIYHFPFDQQYDNTIVEPGRGECYVRTVEEAEKLGFRRAWRWKGADAQD